MSLVENIKNSGKFNLIVGDFLVKKFGLPSRCNLAKFFSINFSEELKEKVTDFKSFSKISQLYLDSALGNRESLIDKIEELYKHSKRDKIGESNLIDLKNIETIINFDYDTYFEKNYSEELVKIGFSSKENWENYEKTRVYKVFGDLSQKDKIMVTFQDFRKYKILPMYDEYLKLLISEFSKRETLILGDEFEDPDFLDFLEYLLKKDKKISLKPIYFISSKEKLESKIENFISENDIEVVKTENLEEFIKSNNFNKFDKETQLNDILEEQKEFQEVVEESEKNILKKIDLVQEELFAEKENEILTLVESDGIFFETAAEIRFRSMKLEENPIYYSNIDISEEGMKNLKLGANSLRIGETLVLGAKIRLIGDDNLKFLEIKTREFRIKTSVRVTRNGEVFKDGNYLEYEIYSVNNVRLKQILEMFIDIFSGAKLNFKSDNLNITLNLSHNLHQLKFQIVKEAEKTYEEFFKGTGEEKKFYSTDLSYYQIFLLNSYVRKNSYDSWANFVLDKEIDLENNNGIVAIRDHKIRFPEGAGTLREKIQLIEPVEIDRIVLEDGKSKLKHAKIKITLEKIS